MDQIIQLVQQEKKSKKHVPYSNEVRMELLVGDEVLELLNDCSLLESWDALYHSCSWATPYQGREYVNTWYQLYHDRYLPVIFMMRTNNRLTGLLTLAVPKYKAYGRAKFVVAAGNFDADYQTWLLERPDDGSFIKAAIEALWKHFPGYDVMLKYITPATPLEWIEADPKWKRLCALQQFTRHLVDMRVADISRHNRKRVNRMKRISRFERVTDVNAFSAMLNGLGQLFDFRQGAMFNKNPFRDDEANRKLLLSLFSLGMLHVTVLKVNEEIIAAVAAIIGKNRVHLAGINCHSPLYADHSPGMVHFILLGQQLAEEGFEYFDLTPGYDSYKERLATSHEQVHQLVATRKKWYFYKRGLRKIVYNLLLKAGLRPMSVELSIKKHLYQVRHRGILASAADWLKGKWKKNTQKLYQWQPTLSPGDAACPLLQKDSLSDLLDFAAQRGVKPSRWEFLSASMRYFEQGAHCYTWSAQGRLLCCAWAGAYKPAEAEAEGVCLQGIYCHETAKDKLPSFIKAVALAAGSDTEKVYALSSDRSISQALHTLGFSFQKEELIPAGAFNFLKS